LTYTVGAVQVFLNGVLLNASDYTASNGTSVVLASACLSGDIVEFIVISGGSVAVTGITVGSTVISGGSTGRVLYDNAGLVGEIAAGTSGNVLTSDGTSWSSAAASPTNGYRRNRIINGGMQVDQRNAGASQTFTAAAALAYSVDRWYGYCTGANVTGQRVAGSSINQYRYQFTGAASVTAIGFGQRIEAANSYDLNNDTATFSVDLANSLLTTVTWTASYANTTDTFGTLASPTTTQIATGTFTVTSTVTNYTASISVPAAATTGIQIVLTVGAQTSGTWTVGNVQLEAGSVATPFERLPISETLMLCQRYYLKLGGATAADIAFSGFPTSGIFGYLTLTYPVTMRTNPTGSIVGTWTSTNVFGTPSLNLGSGSVALQIAATTLGTGYQYYTSGTSTYLTFSAEL
jgi:hypothetical protein